MLCFHIADNALTKPSTVRPWHICSLAVACPKVLLCCSRFIIFTVNRQQMLLALGIEHQVYPRIPKQTALAMCFVGIQ
ncbi:hypothetical protein P367_08255 [Comamonas thiooxydans]|nr:hypothetical protein P369_07255 [Comamonas thiooxydans]KGG99797.1 hypothetical protein P367_08255 [Comamonas thiooxydans]